MGAGDGRVGAGKAPGLGTRQRGEVDGDQKGGDANKAGIRTVHDRLSFRCAGYYDRPPAANPRFQNYKKSDAVLVVEV
jgi:hypothetical protein